MADEVVNGRGDVEMRAAIPVDLGNCGTAELLSKVSHYFETNG